MFLLGISVLGDLACEAAKGELLHIYIYTYRRAELKFESEVYENRGSFPNQPIKGSNANNPFCKTQSLFVPVVWV